MPRRKRPSLAFPAPVARPAHCQRWTGSTIADGLATGRARTRAPSAARSSGSSIFGSVGSTLSGRLAFLQHPVRRILVGRQRRSRRRRRAARRCRRRSARRPAIAGVARRPLPSRDQRRRRARSACRPCASRARRPSAAGSRPDTTCPGRNAASRPARSARAAGGSAGRRSARLVGPTAAVFHSARLEIVDRDEGRLAAHGQPDVLRREIARRPRSPSASSCVPGVVGERLGDARRLGDAVDAHLEVEIDVRRARPAPVIGAAER